MSGLFGGLFERKAATASGGAAVSRAVSQSPSRYGMWSSTGPWDIDRALTDAYEKDFLVYRCVDVIATNQSSIPIVHRKGDARHGTLIRSPKLMMLLNVRPNIYETAAMFRYRLTAQALLSRKGAFIEIVGDPRDPESLHLLPPQSVEPIPDARTFVKGYKVRSVDQTETTLKPEQVIWVRLKPHPIDPYQQTTPLMAAGISVETDVLARLFNRNFLLNDGRPGLLISVRGQINPDDAAELKRRFGGGPQGAGQTTVIEGEGLDIADLGATPRDAQWSESIKASKEDILLAFGVPESVMGNASGRTFDNADAEYEMFWTHTMKPHCEALSGALDPLTGSITDDTTLAFDYSTVDVLQRQENRRQDAVINRWQQGAYTWDEMREELGRSTRKDQLASRIIMLPGGWMMGTSDDDNEKIMDLPNIAKLAPAAPAGAEGEDPFTAAARQGAQLGARDGARQLGNILSARALALAGKQIIVEQEGAPADDAVPLAVKQEDIVDAVLVHPYEQERKEVEARLDGVLISMLSRQQTVIADRLMHTKSRKGTRHWDFTTEEKAKMPSLKPLDPLYAVEIDRWARETREDFGRVLKPVMQREARRVADDMDRNSFAKPTIPDQNAIIKAVLDEVLDVVEKSARNQSKRLADRIKELDSQGMSIEDITKDIRKQVGTRSSWRKGLATNVTTSAIEGIKHDVYSTAGAAIRKTWNTEGDERVRDSHFFVDGKTLKAHELFYVGGTMMRRPGDPLAPVEEVANCRCWLTYSRAGRSNQ